VLTDTSGLGDIYIKNDDSCDVKMFSYLSFMLYINYAYIDHVVMGINATLLQFNQCQLFEPHEPLAILVEYDMCSSLLFPYTSGWANEQDWHEDYRDEY
jgi:hypothetical protein